MMKTKCINFDLESIRIQAKLHGSNINEDKYGYFQSHNRDIKNTECLSIYGEYHNILTLTEDEALICTDENKIDSTVGWTAYNSHSTYINFSKIYTLFNDKNNYHVSVLIEDLSGINHYIFRSILSPENTENIIPTNLALFLLTNYLSTSEVGVILHSSSIVFNDEAYLFIGKSGTGKSTIAAKLLDPIIGLLADDRVYIALTNYCITANSTPFDSKLSYIKPYSEVPVKQIVFLEQGSSNQLTTLDKNEAFIRLISTNIRPLRFQNRNDHKSIRPAPSYRGEE